MNVVVFEKNRDEIVALVNVQVESLNPFDHRLVIHTMSAATASANHHVRKVPVSLSYALVSVTINFHKTAPHPCAQQGDPDPRLQDYGDFEFDSYSRLAQHFDSRFGGHFRPH
ncbi:hypothetical protein SERLA73DRAFT_175599 [Serpula lacrymans var. lacrymans S7.3]|uniref:Uncharacterized protein n=1 Tax=Serpula lacrymans var. lacrymans (strain S7.3) TaxID=936435 RepID=F8PKV4_SERL3|nr:hypothetical protein SERLA73DRAFT_175599 [Serpula lacrymans var. lacrymans S7.3]